MVWIFRLWTFLTKSHAWRSWAFNENSLKNRTLSAGSEMGNTHWYGEWYWIHSGGMRNGKIRWFEFSLVLLSHPSCAILPMVAKAFELNKAGGKCLKLLEFKKNQINLSIELPLESSPKNLRWYSAMIQAERPKWPVWLLINIQSCLGRFGSEKAYLWMSDAKLCMFGPQIPDCDETAAITD